MGPSVAGYRIALVAACELPSPRGSQALFSGVAQLLARRGHEVHAVAFSSANDTWRGEGIRVHAARKDQRSPLPLGPSVRRLADDAALALTLLSVVRRHRIDVIHAHNYEAAIAACLVKALTRTPVVYHAHNVLSDELEFYAETRRGRAWAKRLGSTLDRWVPSRADFTIALTSEVAEFLKQCQVSSERMRVVPPVIAPLPLHRSPEPAARQTEFVVAYGGNLDPYQDLDVLGRGFAQFAAKTDRVLLHIATHEKDWRNRVGREILGLVERGRAHVLVDQDAVGTQRRLEGADVLVCPRRSWSGYPMKLFNYAAAAKPIVAAAGSAKQLLDGESALVFADGDSDGLAAALSRLHGDRALRRRLGDGAAAQWRRMSDSAEAGESFEAIYRVVRNGMGPSASPCSSDC